MPSWNKWIIRKTRAIYIKNILFLDFVHGVTDIQILNLYISDTGSTSVFRQEALKLLGPLDQAILGHCVKKDRRIFSENGNRAGFRSAVIQCLYICKQYGQSPTEEDCNCTLYTVVSTL
jgi:hypothetical protein